VPFGAFAKSDSILEALGIQTVLNPLAFRLSLIILLQQGKWAKLEVF
jgi:hypothetical protein